MQNCFYYEKGNFEPIPFKFEKKSPDQTLCALFGGYDFEAITWKDDNMEGIVIFAYIEDEAYRYEGKDVRYIIDVGFPDTEAVIMVENFLELLALLKELLPLIMINLTSIGNALVDEIGTINSELGSLGSEDDDDDDEEYGDFEDDESEEIADPYSILRDSVSGNDGKQGNK